MADSTETNRQNRLLTQLSHPDSSLVVLGDSHSVLPFLHSQQPDIEPAAAHRPDEEWRRMFNSEHYLDHVKELGLKGRLRSGIAFRSVCWKIFLGVLPEQRREWKSKTLEDRQRYSRIRKKHVTEPFEKMKAQDNLVVNNPLSQETESPWNQYFQDDNLRREIKQDVDRTFPEVEFFKDSRIRTMLMDVLFCYAKEHSNLAYRQGVHELLAPIIFVVDSDKRDSSDNLDSQSEIEEEMNLIMDSDSVESDSFLLLEALMESCHIWYIQKVEIRGLEGKKRNDQQLFIDEERAELMSSPLAKKLDRIQNKVLREHDPVLHSHLERLGIAPQVYGIRWIRLLFGREFPLEGLLVVWDAIFAYSPSLSLVDYICVAMLQFIRNILIGEDYPTCMQMLMRFPSVGDTHYLVERALHLRNPKIYPEPPSWQYHKVDTSPILPRSPRKGKRFDGVGKAITSKASKVATPVAAVARHLVHKRSPQQSNTRHNTADTQDKLIDLRQAYGVQQTSHVRGDRTSDHSTSADRSSGSEFHDGSLPTSSRRWSSSVDLNELQKELDKKETLCLHCSHKMDTFLDQLQDNLHQVDLPHEQEDNVLLALAGLKQVRDLLKGTLKLSGTVTEMDMESLTTARRTRPQSIDHNPFDVTHDPSSPDKKTPEDNTTWEDSPLASDTVAPTPPITSPLNMSPLSDPLGAAFANPPVTLSVQPDEDSGEVSTESPVVSSDSGRISPFEPVEEELTQPDTTEDENYVLVDREN